MDGSSALKIVFRSPIIFLILLFGIGYILEGINKLTIMPFLIGGAFLIFAYIWWKLPVGYSSNLKP